MSTEGTGPMPYRQPCFYSGLRWTNCSRILNFVLLSAVSSPPLLSSPLSPPLLSASLFCLLHLLLSSPLSPPILSPPLHSFPSSPLLSSPPPLPVLRQLLRPGRQLLPQLHREHTGPLHVRVPGAGGPPHPGLVQLRAPALQGRRGHPVLRQLRRQHPHALHLCGLRPASDLPGVPAHVQGEGAGLGWLVGQVTGELLLLYCKGVPPQINQ